MDAEEAADTPEADACKDTMTPMQTAHKRKVFAQTQGKRIRLWTQGSGRQDENILGEVGSYRQDQVQVRHHQQAE